VPSMAQGEPLERPRCLLPKVSEAAGAAEAPSGRVGLGGARRGSAGLGGAGGGREGLREGYRGKSVERRRRLRPWLLHRWLLHRWLLHYTRLPPRPLYRYPAIGLGEAVGKSVKECEMWE
jgi:hypothetical protein